MSAYTFLHGLKIVRLERTSAAGWLLAFRCSDSDIFLDAVERIKDLPRQHREWRKSEAAWWISDARIYDLAVYWPELGDLLMAGGSNETGSSSSRRGTRSGGKRKAPGGKWAHVPADVLEAFEVLDLLPSARHELVAASRRIAAKHAHPDAGGRHDDMVSINNAADLAASYAKAHPRA